MYNTWKHQNLLETYVCSQRDCPLDPTDIRISYNNSFQQYRLCKHLSYLSKESCFIKIVTVIT